MAAKKKKVPKKKGAGNARPKRFPQGGVEKALRESEVRYRDLADSITDIFFAMDKDLRYTYWNKASEKLTGIPAQDAIGKTIYEIFSDTPDTLRAVEVYKDVIRTRQPRSFVNEHHLGGKHLFFEIDAYPSAEGIVVFTKDITGRRQVEEALRKERDFAESVVGTAQAIILVLDTEGHIVYINPYMEEISGYSVEDVKGKDWFETFLPLRVQESTRSLFLKAIGDIQTHGNVDVIITKDGRERLIEWYDTTLKSADGRIEGLLAIGQDVTKRKRAEEALAESEETFKALAENANDGILVAVSGEVHTFANKRAGEITGYSVSELLKTSIKDLANPDELEMITDRYRKILRGEPVPPRYETAIISKDKKRVPIEVTSAKTVWHGQPADLVIIRDITERKRTEEALKESEEKFRSMVDTSPDMIWEIDRQGNFTYISSQSGAQLGYAPEDLVGKPIFSLIQAESVPAISTQFLTHVQEKRSFTTLDVPAKRRDGSPCIIEIRSISITGKEGQLTGFRGVARDITERKRAEEALIKSQIQLAEAMDLAQLVNWEFDVATGIFTFDDRFYVLYGTTAEREGGNQMPAEVYAREFVHPDDQHIVADEVNKAIQATDPDFVSQVEHRIIRRDGEIRHIVVRFGITKDAKGRTIKTHGANQDITSRKMMEDEIRTLNTVLEQRVEERTRSLNKSLQEKDILFKEVHHRVKNNMQIIISLLNLQSRSIDDPFVLKTIKESQNRIRAMALVHERLYRSGDISTIDLKDYIQYLARELFSFYGVRSHLIRLNVNAPAINVNIDTAIPLGLMVNELISNAIKYAFTDEKKGEIIIDIAKDKNNISLVVRDNGVGIPADFDWRNAKSLGLRLVISLVEQLQGTIELDRTAGTTFKIVVKEKE